MTAPAPTTVACPQCTSTNGVPMTDGTRLCLECRHEWNPVTAPHSVTAPPPGEPSGAGTPPAPPATTPPAVPVEVPQSADDVLGPPPSERAARDATAALDALVGTEVVLEGGQRATIVEFPDDDHVTVWFTNDGDITDTVVVDFNDVVRSIDAPPPALDVPDETAVALARVNMAVAALVLQAGTNAVAGEYPNAELVTPPTGWLPDDADSLPAIEQGAAYAVAFLIHAYSIDREQVLRMAQVLLTDAQQPTPTKGGS